MPLGLQQLKALLEVSTANCNIYFLSGEELLLLRRGDENIIEKLCQL